MNTQRFVLRSILKQLAIVSLFTTFVAVLAIGLLDQTRPASAAPTPVTQCNGVGNGGGQGYACFVVVDNYLAVNSSGEVVPAGPSTVSLRVCNGAAGPFLSGPLVAGPLPVALCGTTVVTPQEGPVTSISQCNGTISGGGSALICSVIVNNHFIASSPVTPIALTVYQCEGSATTGDVKICSPLSNVGAGAVKTVAQCNGSANGGGSAVRCNVTGSQSTALQLTIAQCNESGSAGTLVQCTTAVNTLVTYIGTATPTATPTASPTVAPTESATPLVTPVVTRVTTPAPPTATARVATVAPAIIAAVNAAAATVGQPAATIPNVVPSANVPAGSAGASADNSNVGAPIAAASSGAAAGSGAQAAATASGLPTSTTGATTTATGTGTGAAATFTNVRPPNTGSGGIVGTNGTSDSVPWLLSLATLSLVLLARATVAERQRR